MANSIQLADHRFIRLSKPIKYLIVVSMILVATILVYLWILLLQHSAWFISLAPIFYLLLPLLEKPISILSGAKNYYSPLLIVWGKNKKVYSIHLGTQFDLLMALDFNAKPHTYKTQVLIYTFEGFLNIIDELKKTKNYKARIIATSYFLSKNTAERFGFESKKPTRKQMLLLITLYFNLTLVKSIIDRKLNFPNLFQTTSIEIDARSLIDQELKIRRGYEYLRSRLLKAKAAQEQLKKTEMGSSVV